MFPCDIELRGVGVGVGISVCVGLGVGVGVSVGVSVKIGNTPVGDVDICSTNTVELLLIVPLVQQVFTQYCMVVERCIQMQWSLNIGINIAYSSP